MPTVTPLPLIKPANWLFASIGIEKQNNVFSFSPMQLPSTYYMDENGEFIRLRPLHEDGFAVFRRAERAVALYAGDWDDALTFNDNLRNNTNVIGYSLGRTSAEISGRIAALQANAVPFQNILNHNAAPVNQLQNTVWMVADGLLQGTVWGGDERRTTNLFRCMDVVDISDPNSRGAHTGHSFIAREAARQFYYNYYPGVLEQLWLLGQSRQSFTIDLAPKGRAQPIVLHSNLEYFAERMFENREEQLALLRSLYMSFV